MKLIHTTTIEGHAYGEPPHLELVYSIVHVFYVEERHECCVTASMWQSTFGPYELHHMHDTINKKHVCSLMDDGATNNFLN